MLKCIEKNLSHNFGLPNNVVLRHLIGRNHQMGLDLYFGHIAI